MMHRADVNACDAYALQSVKYIDAQLPLRFASIIWIACLLAAYLSYLFDLFLHMLEITRINHSN